MIGLGVWFELLDQEFEAVVDGEQIRNGAYLIVAAGCAVIILAALGILGALCDYKTNRILLFVVSY